MKHQQFMQTAIALSLENTRMKKQPFGAVVVRNGEIIAQGRNQVFEENDPTSHAEIVAIRRACQTLQTYLLRDCELYTSCEPCPMCLGAIYWSGLKRIYYGNSKEDANEIGFSDQSMYEELDLPTHQRRLSMTQLMRDEANEIFQTWLEARNNAAT